MGYALFQETDVEGLRFSVVLRSSFRRGYTAYHSSSVATYVSGSAAIPALIAASSSGVFLRILKGFFITINFPVVGFAQANYSQSSLPNGEDHNMKTGAKQHKSLDATFRIVTAKIWQISSAFPLKMLCIRKIDAMMAPIADALCFIPLQNQHAFSPQECSSYWRLT